MCRGDIGGATWRGVEFNGGWKSSENLTSLRVAYRAVDGGRALLQEYAGGEGELKVVKVVEFKSSAFNTTIVSPTTASVKL